MNRKLRAMFIISLCVGQIVAASVDVLEDWAAYKRKFGKKYPNVNEDTLRFDLFRERSAAIREHNSRKLSSKMALSKFSDWTDAEVDSLFGDMPSSSSDRLRQQVSLKSVLHRLGMNSSLDAYEIPKRLDWSLDATRVGPVKDQTPCSSCWSHAVTGLLEGQQVSNYLTDELIPLSDQQLIDCVGDGCRVGYPTGLVLGAIRAKGGIQSAEDYPYLNNDGECHFERSKAIMSVDVDIAIHDMPEEDVRHLVAIYGPIAASLRDICKAHWRHLSGEILDPDRPCLQIAYEKVRANHAVLIVGYDTDSETGENYWIVKNSWGADWNESGYLRVKRGQHINRRIGKEIYVGSVV